MNISIRDYETVTSSNEDLIVPLQRVDAIQAIIACNNIYNKCDITEVMVSSWIKNGIIVHYRLKILCSGFYIKIDKFILTNSGDTQINITNYWYNYNNYNN